MLTSECEPPQHSCLDQKTRDSFQPLALHMAAAPLKPPSLSPAISHVMQTQRKDEHGLTPASPHFMGITVCSQERFLQETQRKAALLSLPNPAPSLTTGMCEALVCSYQRILSPSHSKKPTKS